MGRGEDLQTVKDVVSYVIANQGIHFTGRKDIVQFVVPIRKISDRSVRKAIDSLIQMGILKEEKKTLIPIEGEDTRSRRMVERSTLQEITLPEGRIRSRVAVETALTIDLISVRKRIAEMEAERYAESIKDFPESLRSKLKDLYLMNNIRNAKFDIDEEEMILMYLDHEYKSESGNEDLSDQLFDYLYNRDVNTVMYLARLILGKPLEIDQ